MLKKEGNGWARGAEDVSEGGKKDEGGGGGAGSGRNQITPPESDCVCVLRWLVRWSKSSKERN